MSFGGDGGGAKTISPSQEYGKILNIFQKQALPAYNRWVGTQPLLQEATGLAQQQYAALPSYQADLTQAYQGSRQLPGQLSDLIALAGTHAVPESALEPALWQTYQHQLTPILQSGGALTPEQEANVRAKTFDLAAQMGMGHTTGTLGTELLNRDEYRQQRYGTALNQALGIGQGITALNQAQLGRAQSAAQSLYALGQVPFQNALQYAQAQQALAAGTAQGLYGAEQAPISAYGSLLNPVGQNVSQVIGYNLNAQNAANQAASNKQAGTTGALIGAAGQVGAAAVSDERLKEGIKATGEKTPEGIPIKEFSYRDGTGRRFRGVIAQDVEKVRPDAVVTTPSGHKLVDLSVIDGPFEEISARRSKNMKE
jgi:Chaperone of endosialidase